MSIVTDLAGIEGVSTDEELFAYVEKIEREGGIPQAVTMDSILTHCEEEQKRQHEKTTKRSRRIYWHAFWYGFTHWSGGWRKK
jgi:hypothetical protein